MSEDQITIIVKDAFIEIDEKNGRSLFRQVIEVRSFKDGFGNWVVVVYPIHDRYGGLNFSFSTREKANGFIDIIYRACFVLDNKVIGTNDEKFVYEYG